MVNARRFYLYVMAFVGLQSVLVALAGMLALLVSTLLLQSHTVLGGKREEASFYLAALVVGLPIWLVHRFFAERDASRMTPAQQASLPRRLFYAAVLGTTMVVTLVAFQGTLQFLLSMLVYPAQVESALEGAIRSGTRLVVFSLAGLLLNRVLPPRAGRDLDAVHDEIRDFARFVVAGVALVLFALGLGRALRLVCADLVLIFGNLPQVLAGPREAIMSAWASPVAGVLSGGTFSAVIWRSEHRRRFACAIRVLFLSLVIIIAAAITLLGSVWVAAELLRGLLGYRAIFDTWNFMCDWLPVALVGELLWIVHWVLLRQQAEFRSDGSVDAGGIPWPRRPVLAALTLLGLVTMAPALASLLWLWLDGLFHTGIALVGNNWWQERLSFGLAAAVVGGVLWIGTWRYLERALATGAVEERRSTARRFLLGFVALTASLIAVGFFVAMLWIAFRSLLGEALTPGTVSLAFKELSIVVLAMMIALYYGIQLRGDVLQTRGMAERTLALMVLADTDTAAEQLAMLQKQRAVRVTAVGRLKADTPVAVFDAAALPQMLTTLRQEQQDEQALVVLQGGRVTLYRFYPWSGSGHSR